MVISARIHYATIALLELALRSDEALPVAASEITERCNVPGPFLVQILRALRSAGWVQSVRGAQGGYRISVDPSQLSLLDIAEALGCQEGNSRLAANATFADTTLQSVWDQANEASRAVLNGIRLSDLVDQYRSELARHDSAAMFYI